MRRFSRSCCLEGVATPEAGNNAVVGGSLVPLLTLGIPGSATSAVLLGALMLPIDLEGCQQRTDLGAGQAKRWSQSASICFVSIVVNN